MRLKRLAQEHHTGVVARAQALVVPEFSAQISIKPQCYQ